MDLVYLLPPVSITSPDRPVTTAPGPSIPGTTPLLLQGDFLSPLRYLTFPRSTQFKQRHGRVRRLLHELQRRNFNTCSERHREQEAHQVVLKLVGHQGHSGELIKPYRRFRGIAARTVPLYSRSTDCVYHRRLRRTQKFLDLVFVVEKVTPHL